ncbi:MAG: CRISPR-associated endoribonuclease Cas6 [Bacteroidales bacterium]|nr:CRISPR-associated endoribonuclease Cas6 [Bacteroidales bacterium]
MRLLLKLEIKGQNEHIPINYQYEISSWIYKLIHYGNSEFAEWLHTHGFMNKNKQFKLFTFSNLMDFRYKQKADRLQILSNEVSLLVSFYSTEIMDPFISGIFQEQEFSIGDKISSAKFYVKSVEKLPEPQFEEKMKFRLISPVHLIQKNPFNENKTDHLPPLHKDFEKLFISNLIEKYNSYNEVKDFDTDSFSLKILREPVRRLIKIKADKPGETKLTGYLFDFEFNSSPELNRIGFYAGFGKSNSLGFGCGEVV